MTTTGCEPSSGVVSMRPRSAPLHASTSRLLPCPFWPGGVAHASCPSASANPGRAGVGRSEEHTSELQSHSDLVCRLLLEKKKTTKRQTTKELKNIPTNKSPILLHKDQQIDERHTSHDRIIDHTITPC